eukprot:scaffold62180_cov36-Tisochrysis_lutea.AAC.2
MAGAPEQQPPTLIERMLAWSLARWDGYEELERHALRSAIASGRAAINAGHSTAAAASNLVGNIQELSEERAMEGAAQCKALAQRAHHEYPECVIAAATLAGAVTGGSRLSAAASGGLATVAVASSFGRKWALPPESYAWIVEAHGSATKELGKAVRMTMAGARSHKDKMVATAYSSLGSINKVVSIMEDSMRSEYRKLCTAYHGLVRQYPERLVALSYAMGLGYLSAQNGEAVPCPCHHALEAF